MMEFNFLDHLGLTTFLNQLKNLFATKKNVAEVKEKTDPYILDINYTALEFNTNMIISSPSSSSGSTASSAMINEGQVGFMIIAE